MLNKPISQLRRFVCIAMSVFFAEYATAATAPSVHITPKPKWLNSYKLYDKPIPQRDIENGFFYSLIEEQINVELKIDYVHIVRQIVSEAGIQNGAEITINLDPAFERLDVHEITVWRNNQPLKRLSPGSFKMIANEQSLSRFIYQGSYSAYCILNDIRKGDRIEYSYSLTGRNPIFDEKFSTSVYLQSSQPVAHLYKAILASPGRKLNFKTFNKAPKMNTYLKNGLKLYDWEGFQIPAVHDYKNQPGWYTNYGYVQVSDYQTWKEVVDWGLQINPITTTFTGKLSTRISELKAKAGKDKAEYFRAAVKMVQNEIRYMGIETGEYSHRANSPGRVYDQRYGDCKDKSLLLASILKANGIEANLALISTYAGIKTDQYLPSPNVFDHAVVRAVVNNVPVWVDATISYQGGTGSRIFFPNYGKGLLLQPGSNALTDIIEVQAGDIKYIEEYIIPIDSTKVTLDVRTTYTLSEADNVRSRLAEAGMSETEKNYLDYYAKIYPKIERIDSVEVYDNEDFNELIVIEHYQVPDFFKKNTDGRNEAAFYANFISEKLTEADNKNRYPLLLSYPCNIDYTIKIQLHSGWNIEKSKDHIKREAYDFQSNVYADRDSLVLNYKLQFFKNFIAVDKLDEYVADVKNIKDNHLSYSFSYAPSSTSTVANTNYWMVLIFFIIVLICAIVGAVVYHRKTPEIIFEPGATFRNLTLWPILLGISLAATTFIIPVTLNRQLYFDLDAWKAISNTPHEFATKAVLIFEVIGNTLMACYAMFCLILLLNKRDILPRFITWFYIGITAFLISDAVCGFALRHKLSDNIIQHIVLSIIVGALWIRYFKTSVLVRETFIVPYPHGNYRYELWEANKPEES